jgi:hypothetical protein
MKSDSDDSDEELEAVKQDYVDETGVEQKRVTTGQQLISFCFFRNVSKRSVLKPCESLPPVLCNTALNLLRFFGMTFYDLLWKGMLL